MWRESWVNNNVKVVDNFMEWWMLLQVNWPAVHVSHSKFQVLDTNHWLFLYLQSCTYCWAFLSIFSVFQIFSICWVLFWFSVSYISGQWLRSIIHIHFPWSDCWAKLKVALVHQVKSIVECMLFENSVNNLCGHFMRYLNAVATSLECMMC